MLLATYNLNPSCKDEDYDRFCVEVDNPFYNSIPGVSYWNWKVVENKLGTVGFKYFDQIIVDSDDPFALFENNEDVKAFVAKWETQWAEFGTDPGFLGKNYQIAKVVQLAGPDA